MFFRGYLESTLRAHSSTKAARLSPPPYFFKLVDTFNSWIHTDESSFPTKITFSVMMVFHSSPRSKKNCRYFLKTSSNPPITFYVYFVRQIDKTWWKHNNRSNNALVKAKVTHRSLARMTAHRWKRNYFVFYVLVDFNKTLTDEEVNITNNWNFHSINLCNSKGNYIF